MMCGGKEQENLYNNNLFNRYNQNNANNANGNANNNSII